MATSKNKAPSFFSFLKEGFLLPSRNWRLFTAVFALILVSTILLRNDLAFQPHADEVKALNTTEPSSLDHAKLLQELPNNIMRLLLVRPERLLFAVVGAAVRIVVLFAAVLMYSGEQRAATFCALLGQAKAQIKGPLLTFAFVYVLETVCFVLLVLAALSASALLVLPALPGSSLLLFTCFVALFVASLLVLAAAVICLVYFSFLCSFSVVVAVAEPRCHGVAALVKAWRLMKGKKRQVALYLAVTVAMGAAVSPVRTLARACAGNSVALGLLVGFVYVALRALEQLFALCAMTAFYYERREDIDSKPGATGYAKLSTSKEANA